jgi:hypothetical protein
VRFLKVRNVGKLLKAVNAVCFGHYRVRAKIARFDRSVGDVGKLERVDAEMNVVGKSSGGEGKKHVEEGVKVVRVGEVNVQVREGKAKGGKGSSSKVADVVRDVGQLAVPVVEVQQPVPKRLVRMYRLNGNDLNWA